ncbi:MAG: cupin domain-containing protein [Cytophagales bacterium]
MVKVIERVLLMALGFAITCICVFLVYTFFVSDFAFSIIPGWQTEIYPTNVILAITLLVIFTSVLVIYFFVKSCIKLIKKIITQNSWNPVLQKGSKHVVLEEKFSKFTEYWHPYIIGELNDNFVKIAKVKGDLVWHKHDHEDELFLVLSGTLMMDFRDGRTIATKPGEILIVPKNTEHRPWTNDEEVKLMLVEPKATKHTGELVVERTVTNLEWI